MGKQKKKEPQAHKKKDSWNRTCERCGNEKFSPSVRYKCPHCGWWNGYSAGDVR